MVGLIDKKKKTTPPRPIQETKKISYVYVYVYTSIATLQHLFIFNSGDGYFFLSNATI